MPIPLQRSTGASLGNGLLPKCESRSLFACRFADPAADDSSNPTRKDWFNALIQKNAALQFPGTDWLPRNATVIHARLMSRLMVNLAGGVMENANLCLDRYGLPFIPGSAVKGCARRMALQALHDWCATPDTPTEPTLPCRNGFASPTNLLTAISRIFGWVETDWQVVRNRDELTEIETTWKSDFAWAVNGNTEILNAAKSSHPPHDTFAGTIAFLSAGPNRDPKLELDIVTPHHTKYQSGDPQYAGAPDTEDPVPVYFPAVKPQLPKDHFSFPLIPLDRAHDADLESAKTFLSLGLELLGLGAKTHAGYGWFEVLQPEAVQEPNGDYPNEEFFANSVIRLLNQPGQYDKLKHEIEKLRKLENSKWLEVLKSNLLGEEMKRTRKSLRETDWFPKEWLEKPAQ